MEAFKNSELVRVGTEQLHDNGGAIGLYGVSHGGLQLHVPHQFKSTDNVHGCFTWLSGTQPSLSSSSPRIDPSAAADIPDEAQTASSEASSMRRRIVVMEWKTPGSIGGRIGLQSGGAGSGGYDKDARESQGESGGEESPRLA